MKEANRTHRKHIPNTLHGIFTQFHYTGPNCCATWDFEIDSTSVKIGKESTKLGLLNLAEGTVTGNEIFDKQVFKFRLSEYLEKIK